jgi:hypothetical protein
MRLPLQQVSTVRRSTPWGPAWIGMGLGLLVANAWWPAVPVVTAMALVALGATAVTLERFRGTPRAYLVVGLSLPMYVGLYGLFLGATLDHAGHQFVALTAIDLIASVWPMSAAFVKSWQALRRCEPTV